MRRGELLVTAVGIGVIAVVVVVLTHRHTPKPVAVVAPAETVPAPAPVPETDATFTDPAAENLPPDPGNVSVSTPELDLYKSLTDYLTDLEANGGLRPGVTGPGAVVAASPITNRSLGPSEPGVTSPPPPNVAPSQAPGHFPGPPPPPVLIPEVYN